MAIMRHLLVGALLSFVVYQALLLPTRFVQNEDIVVKQTQSPKKILFTIPENDFDPTEAAVPWSILTTAGHKITFATESGKSGSADELVLNGMQGGFMKVKPDPELRYQAMTQSAEYRKPIKFSSVKPNEFDALFLPGGHAPGMKLFLEDKNVHKIVADFFKKNKPVGAICHGVLAVSRATDSSTGKSVLYDRKTTSVPHWAEKLGAFVTDKLLGKPAQSYMMSTTHPLTVAEEIKSVLRNPDEQFVSGPFDLLTTLMLSTENDHTHAFTVRDGNYLSARLFSDAYLIGKQFAQMLEEQ